MEGILIHTVAVAEQVLAPIVSGTSGTTVAVSLPIVAPSGP